MSELTEADYDEFVDLVASMFSAKASLQYLMGVSYEAYKIYLHSIKDMVMGS